MTALDRIATALEAIAEPKSNQARDYPTAASELGVSEAWLREATPTVPLPHHKFSIDSAGNASTRGRGAVVFYDDDMDAIRALFAVRAPDPVTQRNLGRRAARRAATGG